MDLVTALVKSVPLLKCVWKDWAQFNAKSISFL